MKVDDHEIINIISIKKEHFDAVYDRPWWRKPCHRFDPHFSNSLKRLHFLGCLSLGKSFLFCSQDSLCNLDQKYLVLRGYFLMVNTRKACNLITVIAMGSPLAGDSVWEIKFTN